MNNFFLINIVCNGGVDRITAYYIPLFNKWNATGNDCIIIPPAIVIRIKEKSNIPFCQAIIYAHVDKGKKRKIEVSNPGEKVCLTMEVPICAVIALTKDKPTNIYENKGQVKPT